MKHEKPSNHLIHESSPYLLQHAYNPVDWHPWGPEALSKAKKENKLLIVSIGYAACHWCHVMEHESFEDSTVAAIMNEHFVPIKVDREERPDVDDIYMSAAQLISGSGGWPLNAFALPDGRPIWAGTYFPKERWMDILNQFAKLKNDDYPRLVNSANQLTEGIQNIDAIVVTPPGEYSEDDLSNLGEKFIKQTDQINGGRRGAPKFPMPNNYEFLLRYATLTGDPIAQESLEVTLRKMAEGGIYDHVGGGFARYSVDDLWKVPHFEKMLYDNGQLVSLYSQAYRHNALPLYKEVIMQSLEYTAREMTSDEGGFYSSLDADSEGEEGKFYIWKEAEIDALISDNKDLAIYKRYYSLTPEGNWEHGNNILHVTEDPNGIARDNGLTIEELEILIAKWDAVLLEKRAERIRPGLDDKILTSWNALMSKGYIDAYKALGKKEYLETAERNLHFILNKQLQDDFRLNRNYKNGKSSINAFLDDYAVLIDAMIAMYEVTFDESWLNISNDITGYVITNFFDTKSKMFFYTSNIDPALVARKLELSDNVISSSNSIMARNLKRLGELLYNQSYIETSDQMLANIWTNISKVQQPSFYSNWLQLLIEQIYPAYEIAIVGKDALNMSKEMQKSYHPNAVYLGAQNISDLALLENKLVEGETLIYVCQNKTCKFPVKDVADALALMK